MTKSLLTERPTSTHDGTCPTAPGLWTQGHRPTIGHEARSPVAESTPSARHRVDDGGLIGLALGSALVAMTLVAGLCFTFAVAIMPNLAGVDDHTFVEITQRFNQNPVFPLTFTAALVLTGLAAVLHRRQGRGVAARWTIAALVLCAIVVVAITGAIHIPLNYQIDDAGDPDRIADLAHVRDQFEAPWVVWNIVRTVLSIAAVAALGRALLLHGRNNVDRKTGASTGGPSWAPPSGR